MSGDWSWAGGQRYQSGAEGEGDQGYIISYLKYKSGMAVRLG